MVLVDVDVGCVVFGGFFSWCGDVHCFGFDGSLFLRSPQCTVRPNLRKCVVMRDDAVCRSCRFRKMKAALLT
jgi:hypothetical protein